MASHISSPSLLASIEVLRMGHPFDTCLALDSFSSFAAIGNAADVNKPVLYARDNHGVILATACSP